MARYTTTVTSPWSPAEAFAYMADMRNFVDWDPGVRRAELVAGDGPGPDAEYLLAVKGFVGGLEMRYRTLDHQPDSRILLRADTRTLASVDEIVVSPVPSGCTVTYDAELTLKGPLGLLDPALGLAFKGIGDRAAAGMRRVLGARRSTR